MPPEEARSLLLAATWQDHGTFTLLRLGEDPGAESVRQLRLALRVLWRHWKDKNELPYDIAHAAAMTLYFRSEAERNLRDAGRPLRDRVLPELADLAQGSFELLSGPNAGSEVAPRPDLGE